MIEKIKKILNSSQYNFLRSNPKLKNMMLLTVGGSHAYGTNNENSDIDIRGICLENIEEYWGLSRFEQFTDSQTDTVIYGFKKLINLLLNCNPNIIEILGTNEEHIFQISEAGKLLRNNVDLFLSKKVYYSFGGYATSQLRRLQNALARDEYPQKEKEKHILGSIENQFEHFQREYQKFTKSEIKLYLNKSCKKDFDEEIFIDINLNHYPLRDLKSIYSDMNNVIKNYESLNHRNNKKDELHLNKHAMHLVRLLIMGTEILETGKINTFRKDREFLLKIRDGYYSYEHIFQMVDDLEKNFKDAYERSLLPEKSNSNAIEKFMIKIYSQDVINQIINI